MKKNSWIVFVVLFLLARLVNAQDCIERLKALQVESLSYDVLPSKFYFDFQLLEEEKDGQEVTLSRYIGQQICDGAGRKRLDFELTMSYGGGESRSKEYFIEFSSTERQKFVSILGSPAQKSRSEDVSSSMMFVNPFQYVLGGCTMLQSKNSAIENVAKGFQRVDLDENSIRNVGDEAVVFKSFTFAREPIFKFSRGVVYRVVKGCDPPPTKTKWSEIPNLWEQMKIWHKTLTVNAEWKDVEGIGCIPTYIHSIRDGHVCNDLTARSEFEGFFWGEEFEKDFSKYFSRDRLNNESLEKDFPVAEIEKQASKNQSKRTTK
jgi:hypothetical protein